MSDLYVTIDMFRTGEYKPEDYKEALIKAGVKYTGYKYDAVYNKHIKELDDDNLIKFLRSKHRPVVTMCGDTSDMENMLLAYEDLALQGNIVFIDAVFNKSNNNLIDADNLKTLKSAHFDKILMSNMLYVVKNGNNITPDMQEQIDFASKHNIPIKYSDEL
jgi:hypothetical protein